MVSPPNKNPTNTLDKISVHLEHACFICGIILSGSKTCIEHVKNIHRYVIPFRPPGRRPENAKFSYTSYPDDDPWTIEEYACPSCWYHSPSDDLEALNEHIREEHNPTRVKKEEYEEEYEEDDVEMEESEFVQEITTKLDELKALFEEILS
ncbi:hypothetical protein MFLAVUS_004759 [Mucor flavus]|uniref:C2H2-type domain-containing protein n=1 Tax=Mucor flavus TaxID=439312 RepID=A0ABP9YWT7_9FUNG